ncbi:hypothetical protein HZC21_05620 [Candidatus Peregrinibacteria bacterium]|nr:hypothetical protein [Candidatus Peregrinibacteria bacterium]
MFKENRLIFKSEQPKESGQDAIPQPDKVPGRPEGPFGFFAKALGSLEEFEKLAEKQAKINAVFDKFKPFLEKEYGLLRFLDLQKKVAKLNKQQDDALSKALEEGAIIPLIAEQIEAGYEFVEFNNNGLAWTWRDPAGNLITRINPLFQLEGILPALSNEAIDQLKKLREEFINKDLEAILQILIRNGFIADKTPMEYLKTTNFARDIREALEVVHSLPAGHGYILDITEEGKVNFLLEDRFLKGKGYKDLSYNIKDYYRYPKQPTKPIETEESTITFEEIKDELPKTFEEVEDEGLTRMDDIAKEYPELQGLNTDFKELFTDIKNAIKEEMNQGTAPENIRNVVRTTRPDIDERWKQLANTAAKLPKGSAKTEFLDLTDNLTRGMIENFGIPTTE